MYPTNALVKYCGLLRLDTSNLRASATKIPKGKQKSNVAHLYEIQKY